MSWGNRSFPRPLFRIELSTSALRRVSSPLPIEMTEVSDLDELMEEVQRGDIERVRALLQTNHSLAHQTDDAGARLFTMLHFTATAKSSRFYWRRAQISTAGIASLTPRRQVGQLSIYARREDTSPLSSTTWPTPSSAEMSTGLLDSWSAFQGFDRRVTRMESFLRIWPQRRVIPISWSCSGITSSCSSSFDLN